ncbi:MAG: beta galactosidase jelly roll domain-containing protein, partial [Armatimonadetes bacterium]|nr:beta galactosidase jelly roll domain-containing protein [Armatimonadota bacterium]
KGEHLSDEFAFRVLAPEPRATAASNIVMLDPAGVTAATLEAMGLRLPRLAAGKPLPAGTKGLVIGREALRADEAALAREDNDSAAEQALPPKESLGRPSLSVLPAEVGEFVRHGGRVVVFEQTERVLSRRLGFRTAFPGVRRTFVRCPWHPVLKGLSDEDLSLWRGEATLTMSHTRKGPMDDPRVDWLGFGNTRVWKWGNYAQVASAVIEKPHREDFLALTDCEFDLDYSPLLEYRDSSGGAVLFCQYDVSGRSKRDPAAERLVRNLLRWLEKGDPTLRPARRTLYTGGAKGASELQSLGVAAQKGRGSEGTGALKPGDLLVVGEGAAPDLRSRAGAIASAVSAGAIVFCLPQKQEDLEGWLPFDVKLKPRPVVFTPLERSDTWLLRALGPSELHWRGQLEAQTLATLPAGSLKLPSGVVGAVPHGCGWYLFCQVTPTMFGADDPQRAYFRLSQQRCAQMLARLLANCGARFDVPLVDYLTARTPVVVDLAGPWRIKADPQSVGDKERWYSPDLDDSSWKQVPQPGFWEDGGADMGGYNGVAWLRRHFSLPRGLPAEGLDLVLGAVDDEDWTWVNGQFVGHRGQDTDPDDYWAVQRRYHVKAELLRPGENVVVVKVRDLRQKGGIARGPLRISEKERWVASYYTNMPVATDDPYRYCRW